jgi:hypothetical protein
MPGDPDHPITWQMLEQKFRDCASFSAQRIPSHKIERAIALVRDLENVSDATEVIRTLVAQ